MEFKKTIKEDKTIEGLICTECGCRHFYTDSTRRLGKQIHRYKHCRNCGRRIVTIEKVKEKVK